MYLPSEGLYSEVHRIPGLIETLRRTHQIMVMGPSVLPGLLHCIRVGHLTLALERKAGAIGEILSAVKAEWSGLGKALDDMARRAQTLSRGIGDAQRRNRGVGRALADRGHARPGPRPTGSRACRSDARPRCRNRRRRRAASCRAATRRGRERTGRRRLTASLQLPAWTPVVSFLSLQSFVDLADASNTDFPEQYRVRSDHLTRERCSRY